MTCTFCHAGGMPHRVVALALPGVVAFDLALITQVFGYADEDEYACVVATPKGSPVQSSTGLTVGGTADLAALAEADTVIVAGYSPHDCPSPTVLTALRAAAAGGARMASVCTGAFALAHAGFLDGRTATTHWQDAEALRALSPRITVDPSVLFIDHGDVATSAGVAAGIDLCLHLVRTDFGAGVAHRVARRMVAAPHRAGGQAQFVPPPAAQTGMSGGLGELLDWARLHLAEPLTVPELARRLHLSERQFARRFVAETGVTPLRWLLHQRVYAAMELLEVTDLSLDTVARRSGLGTASTLRRHVTRELGVTPSAYRDTFRGSPAASTPPRSRA